MKNKLPNKKRSRSSVQLRDIDAPYQKSVDTLNLFISPPSYNVIELLAYHYPLTYAEIESMTKDRRYYSDDIDTILQELINFGILSKKKGLYELCKDKIERVNKAIDLLAKYARQVKLIMLLLLVFVCRTSIAQVNEAVNFNSYVSPVNNDYYNHFTEPWGATGLVPIPDSGITGGCLRTPNTFPASLQAIYCSKYKNQIGATFETSFSFKWDSTKINPNVNFLESASMRLYSQETINSYIMGYLHSDKRLYILNADAPNAAWDTSSTTTSLDQLDWYNLVFTTNTIGGTFGDLLDVTVQLYDLGSSGLNSPVLVNSVSATISNAPFVVDTAIYIDVIGAAWGGCTHIDNFSYHGYKSADSCIPVSTSVPYIAPNEVGLSNPTPNPSYNIAKISYTLPQDAQIGKIDLYDAVGRLVNVYDVRGNSQSIEIQTENLTNGTYYYVLKVPSIQYPTRKLIVLH